MNPPRLDRFARPSYLRHIGRERLTAILLPFAAELATHGIALPATALPEEAFFQLLATLPRQAGAVSPRLLEAMTAIEVLDEVFPDEVPTAPLIVRELRLRLRAATRPILVTPAADPGVSEAGMNGSLAEEAAPYFTVAAESRPDPGTGNGDPPPPSRDTAEEMLAELREQRALLATLKSQIGSIAKELPSHPEPVSDEAAVAVFALMKKLDDGARTRKAPLGRVFRLLVLEGLSQGEVARKCRCTPSLISLRVSAIERRMQRRLSELRLLATRLGEMHATVQDSRARRIYRGGMEDEG